MICKKCNFDNEEGSVICAACREPLDVEEEQQQVEDIEQAEEETKDIEERREKQRKILIPTLITSIIVLLALLVCFYKPVLYNVLYGTAKVTGSSSIAEGAYKFKETEACNDLIIENLKKEAYNLTGNDYQAAIAKYEKLIDRDSANKQEYTYGIIGAYYVEAKNWLYEDPDAALDVAKDGYSKTGSGILYNFVGLVKAMHEYEEDYGTYIAGTVKDGDVVSVTEYTLFLMNVKTSMEQENNLTTASEAKKKKFWAGKDDEGKDRVELLKENTEESIREYKMQSIKAREEGIDLDVAALENSLYSLDYSIGQTFRQKDSDSDATIEKRFKKQIKANIGEYKSVLVDVSLTEQFLSEYPAMIHLSDGDIEREYNENRNDYDECTIKYLLLKTVKDLNNPTQKYSKDKIAQQKKKANKLLKEMEKGGDVDEIIKENTEDPNYSSDKGEISFDKDGMTEPIANWAFDAKVGDFGVIETDWGYAVANLTYRTDFNSDLLTTTGTVKDKAEYYLRQNKMNELIDKWWEDSRFDLTMDDKIVDKIIDYVQVV